LVENCFSRLDQQAGAQNRMFIEPPGDELDRRLAINERQCAA